MSQEQIASLQQQVQALQGENQQLRHELDQIRQRGEVVAQVRKQVVRGGGRLLIPLLDREKVVRSFGKMAETMSRGGCHCCYWPSRRRGRCAAGAKPGRAGLA